MNKFIVALSTLKNYLVELWLNHFVAHIPIHFIRIINYKMAGMNIGKNVRILMGFYVTYPKRITIGDNTIINEFCIINASGGRVVIGSNCSISVRTMIYSGTHNSHSDDFSFLGKDTVLEDHVWTGIGSIVLPGCILRSGCILAAGSVAIPQKNNIYKEKGVYSGVPANEIGLRNSNLEYTLANYRPLFK